MVLSSGRRCLFRSAPFSSSTSTSSSSSCSAAITIRSPLLRRAARQQPAPAAAASPFSTAAARLEKTNRPPAAQRISFGFKKSGPGGAAAEKPRAAFKVGERKEMRNRIVLSNTNAPPLDLPELAAEVSVCESAVGTVFRFRDDDVDRLRALDAFRRTQDWKFFHRPSTVMRLDSLAMGRRLARIHGDEGLEAESPLVGTALGVAAAAPSAPAAPTQQRPRAAAARNADGEFQRAVVCGPKGSGKSVLLLQAMAWALQRGWLVISIPNAHDLVIGHTEYELDAASGLWLQREYTAALLGRIAAANRRALASMAVGTDCTLGHHAFPARARMGDLVEAGSKDAAIAHEALTALLAASELRGPPVLFVLDGLNELMLPSAYRDTGFRLVHAHDLALAHTFLAFLSGRRRFARGLVLAATSGSGARRTEALDYALSGRALPNYSKLDPRVAPSIAGADIWTVAAMKKAEARGLLEYCRDSGLLREPGPLSDEQIAQRLALSSGLPKELVAGCVRLRA